MSGPAMVSLDTKKGSAKLPFLAYAARKRRASHDQTLKRFNVYAR